MWKCPTMSYSEIKNILITTVIDKKFNDIELVNKLELAADRIYDELWSREMQEILEKMECKNTEERYKNGKNS